MKNKYTAPELAVLTVKADERFTAECNDSVNIGDWKNPVACIITREDGPKVWTMNS